jgi:hypothetical protein
MKSDIVVMQDWMKFHPEASPTASYYLRLCNKTLKIILCSDIRTDCDSAERAIQLACILTAYFEDVISDTGLFRTFTEQHGELYGKVLPFYDVTDEYYPDEINLYDLYFLTWHALSLWEKEDGIGILDPFFRHGNHPAAIREIYGLFDSEFENAPQNEYMQQFLRLSPDADTDTIRKQLNFLAENCYLGFIENASFMDSLAEEAEQQLLDANVDGVISKEEVQRLEMSFYDSTVNYLFNHHFSLLAQRASEELAHLAGREHPLYPLLKDISMRKVGYFLFQEAKKTELIFEHLPSKTRINVSKEYLAFESEQMTPDQSCLSIGVVKWGDVWQQIGSAIMFDYSDKDTASFDSTIFDDPEQKKEVLKAMEADFLQANHGKRIAYLKDAEEVCDIYGRFLDINSRSEDTGKMKAEALANIRQSMKGKDELLIFFFNPERGMEYFFGDIVAAVADPDNAYHIPGKTVELEVLLFNPNISGEFIHYLIENSLVTFAASEASCMEVSVMLDNLDFLLRYYKQRNYWPEPGIILKK